MNFIYLCNVFQTNMFEKQQREGVCIKVTHSEFSDYKCKNFLAHFQTLRTKFFKQISTIVDKKQMRWHK